MGHKSLWRKLAWVILLLVFSSNAFSQSAYPNKPIKIVVPFGAGGAIAKMIAADIKFHEFLYSLSGNPLIAPAMATHLTYTQRVMGEVLIEDQEPRDIWDQHAKILEAIGKGKADLAEKLAKEHLIHASQFMVSRLKSIER